MAISKTQQFRPTQITRKVVEESNVRETARKTASEKKLDVFAPGGSGVDLPPPSTEKVGAAVHELRAHLNRNLFDSSPFIVTQREARAAHKTLMSTAPENFSGVIENLDDVQLNRYLDKVAIAEPFAIDQAGKTPLAEFAEKLATTLSPEVGHALVARLDDTGKRRLLEGALQMPSGDMLRSLRTRLGEEGFKDLAMGGRDALAGRGLVLGRFFKENATEQFKARYAAALDGSLPLPEGAKETVFLAGPGLFGDQLPGYFEPNMRALKEWGVPNENVRRFDYNTGAGPEANADAIFEQVKAAHDEGKRVVVLGHSKFGRDMLEAFHRHPELKEMVSGALMMQPALSAQIAKDLARDELKGALDPMLSIVGGDRAAFTGMSQPFEELPPWPDDVATMTLATTTESKKALLRVASHPYNLEHYNVASDGFVAFQDQASLEGSTLVTLPGLFDHAHAGLKFQDAMEHFAVQLDKGAPDEVVAGMLDRARALMPHPKMFDLFTGAVEGLIDTPEERAHSAKKLREIGPALDRIAKVMQKQAGFPLPDNEAVTKAMMSQLFDRME